MADRRRRRKPVNGGDSDESSDESVNGVVNHTLSDLGSDAEAANSEYESADEEDILPPGAEADQENIDAKLDDDEDRKNPQYIPKKGTFYEHDDRTMPPDEENNMMRSEVVTEERFPGADLPVVEISSKAKESDGAEQDGPARLIKKKVWRGDEERWCHDKFEEVEQLPKPREELVSVYGYDIRSEEGAPRARRRRRYGRGPNKYTRNWEDLDAYTRPARGAPVGGPRGGGRGRGRPPHPDHLDEDFPALPGQDGDDRVSTGNGSIKNQDIAEEINSNVTSGDASHSVSSGGAGNSTVKAENRNRGRGRDSGGPGRKQSSNSGSSFSGAGPEPITVQHSTHTYTNQEYRRNKPQQHEFVDEERGTGGRGRGRGGRAMAPRGGGRGRAEKPAGWKQPYGGSGPNTAYDSTNRGSDDVRMLSGGGRGGPPQQQYQQLAAPLNKRGGGGPHSPRSAPSTYQPELPPHHDVKHGGRGAPPQPSSSGGHQFSQQLPSTPHSPHHQPPNYSQQPPPHHSTDQQQHPQQQFPRQKRYSSQRPGRGGAGSGGGQDMGAGSGSNPHYTPHPHHNLYYQDTSTTPPPDSLPSSGLAVNNSAVDSVVYSGGTVIYNDGGGLPVTNNNVHHHLPPPHSVSLPPPPSSQFVATAGPPPQVPFVAQSGFMPRGPVAAVSRLFTPNSQTALLTSGPVSVVGPTAPAGMVGPVLGGPPPIMTGSQMPGAGGPVPVAVVARPPFLPPTDSLLNPGFTGPPPPTAPPQQFQGPPPHPPQFPPFQSYATAPVPTEPAQQPQEVYRNGVMYYNTQSQQPQRSSVTLQKRPKAAIPIVPPPDRADGAADDGGARSSLSTEPGLEDRSDLRDEESNHGEVYADAKEEQMPSEAPSLLREVAGYGEDEQLPSRGKVDAVVDPSDHYALQQLQLQQSEHSKCVGVSSMKTEKDDDEVTSVPAEKSEAAFVEVKPASTDVEVDSLTATVKEDPVTPAAKEDPVIPAAEEEPAAPAAKEDPVTRTATVEPVTAAVENLASVCLPVVKTVIESRKEEEDRPSAPDHPKETATEAINSVDEVVDRAVLESDDIKEVEAVQDNAEHVKDRKPVENMLVQAAEQENVPSRESINGTTGKEV